jgi:hypothetical protein
MCLDVRTYNTFIFCARHSGSLLNEVIQHHIVYPWVSDGPAVNRMYGCVTSSGPSKDPCGTLCLFSSHHASKRLCFFLSSRFGFTLGTFDVW